MANESEINFNLRAVCLCIANTYKKRTSGAAVSPLEHSTIFEHPAVNLWDETKIIRCGTRRHLSRATEILNNTKIESMPRCNCISAANQLHTPHQEYYYTNFHFAYE